MKESYYENLQENIKFLRKEAGMSQAVLAEKLGVQRLSVANYERGENIPRLPTLVDLSEQLKVSLHDLIFKNLAFKVNQEESEKDIYEIPMPKLDFEPYIFVVENNKMSPIIEVNDYVICKEIPLDADIELGKMYAVKTTLEIYFSTVVIRIGDEILVVPANTSAGFKESKIHQGSIVNLYRVRYRITEKF